MRVNSILISSLFLSFFSTASELCGWITQEFEGTWLEVPFQYEDGRVSHKVYNLIGNQAYDLEQGINVCVGYSKIDFTHKQPSVYVTYVKKMGEQVF